MQYWKAGVIGLLAIAPLWAQETPPAPSGSGQPDVAEQLEALRQQVYELNKQVRQLEVQIEDNEKVVDDKAKQLPAVKFDGDGLSITSANKAFQLRIRSRVAYDYAWFDQDEELKLAVGDEQDGTGFRFARLQLQGKFWDDFGFVTEYDFAGENGEDTPKFRDVYLEYHAIPYGGGREMSFRVGHYREPFSLEEQTPVPYRTFVERSLANVFVPQRNAGVQLSDALFGEPKKERLTWAVGAFKDTDDWPSANDSDEDQGYQITGRVTGLPWYEDDGRKLLHLGVAYSLRNPDGTRVNYGVRPESRLSLFRYIDPDNLPQSFRLRDARTDDVNLLGLEAATVFGPFSLQGEYIRSDVDTTFGGDLTFDGYYVQASYFLTGENRPYRNDRGLFDRVVPERNFNWRKREGWGAWEATARYSSVDLTDRPIWGGEQDAITLGLNWYLNPNVRITWNYIHNQVNHVRYDGDFDIFQTRFQFEF
jgi:phosphate-selective porin OprO/OprP